MLDTREVGTQEARSMDRGKGARHAAALPRTVTPRTRLGVPPSPIPRPCPSRSLRSGTCFAAA